MIARGRFDNFEIKIMKQKRWFERKFDDVRDVGLFPNILERLTGTPARLEEKIKNTSTEFLTVKLDDHWSIQENIGHLIDLEPLWSGRVDDFAEGKEELREADLTNTKTKEANHNQNSIEELLRQFRSAREDLVGKMENLEEKDLLHTALHPRLKTPMRILELAQFVAEHDDQHLARMTIIAKTLKS